MQSSTISRSTQSGVNFDILFEEGWTVTQVKRAYNLTNAQAVAAHDAYLKAIAEQSNWPRVGLVWRPGPRRWENKLAAAA